MTVSPARCRAARSCICARVAASSAEKGSSRTTTGRSSIRVRARPRADAGRPTAGRGGAPPARQTQIGQQGAGAGAVGRLPAQPRADGDIGQRIGPGQQLILLPISVTGPATSAAPARRAATGRPATIRHRVDLPTTRRPHQRRPAPRRTVQRQIRQQHPPVQDQIARDADHVRSSPICQKPDLQLGGLGEMARQRPRAGQGGPVGARLQRRVDQRADIMADA